MTHASHAALILSFFLEHLLNTTNNVLDSLLIAQYALDNLNNDVVTMLVDNPLSSSYNFQPNFEDFFNMDLIAGPSNGAASSTGPSSSRSSSGSPPQSFSTLPPTPPNPFSIPDPTIGSYFNFLDDDFSSTKLDPLAPPPTTAAPFDFFAPYTTASTSPSTNSPESGAASGSSPSATDSPLGIDPQLVGTPAQSKALSDFDEDDEDADDLDLNDLDSISLPDIDPPIPTIKVGGRGKAARKGTVQSGGIVKKSSAPSTPPADKKEKYQQSGILTTTSTEPDDWRPTPDEYKKMSSKEKRQLRNKISARNFRVRRKGLHLFFCLSASLYTCCLPRCIDYLADPFSFTLLQNTSLPSRGISPSVIASSTVFEQNSWAQNQRTWPSEEKSTPSKSPFSTVAVYQLPPSYPHPLLFPRSRLPFSPLLLPHQSQLPLPPPKAPWSLPIPTRICQPLPGLAPATSGVAPPVPWVVSVVSPQFIPPSFQNGAACFPVRLRMLTRGTRPAAHSRRISIRFSTV